MAHPLRIHLSFKWGDPEWHIVRSKVLENLSVSSNNITCAYTQTRVIWQGKFSLNTTNVFFFFTINQYSD
jgi:hypothetical protein